MIKKCYHCILLALSLLLYSCNGTPSFPIANYRNDSENFIANIGEIQYDTLPKNLKTHNLLKGNKYVLEYNYSGITFVDANNFEAKFFETLLFQIDTTCKKFKYCDDSLAIISCKYFWICIASDLKKEIRNVRKGCIQGEIRNNMLIIEISIDPGFETDRILEEDKNRLINYKTTLSLNNNLKLEP